MENQLDRIEQKLDILLQRTEPKKKPRQTKIKDTRTLEEQIEPLRGQYAPSMIEDFILYWSERAFFGEETEDGVEILQKEQKWQKQKTWDISKRLERWKRQQDKWQYEREAKQRLKTVDEKPVHREEQVNTGFPQIGNLFNR